MSTTEDQPPVIDEAEFVRNVLATPDDQLAAGMQSELRETILDEIFTRISGRIDPVRSAALNITVGFKITGRPDGGADPYVLTIKEGTCAVKKGIDETPTLTMTLDAVDFMKLVVGADNATDMYIGGKLKMDGNIMMGPRISGLFTIPSPE